MNKVTVFIEERFEKDNEGNFYSNVFNDLFWERYLRVFDSVEVIARAKISNNKLEFNNRLLNPKVKIIEVPYYHGFFGFISIFFCLIHSICKVTSKESKYILRLPGVLGTIGFFFLFLKRKKFGVEIVGDPFQVFSSGGVGGSLRVFMKWTFYHATRLACRKASAVAYVTRSVMQKRYPHSENAFTTYYSSIVLDKEFVVTEKEVNVNCLEKPFHILSVGTMEQRYKGFDLLIRAIPRVVKEHPNVVLTLIGDGFYKHELIELAKVLRVKDHIRFLGKVEREHVFEYMDRSDIFAIASRTEGVPRVLIEAFARGVPSIGSDVGGIPELLENEFIFSSENVDEIVNLIIKVIADRALRKEMSERNILRANEFESSVLSIRREQFYKYILRTA